MACTPISLEDGWIVFHTDLMEEGKFYNYIDRDGKEFMARRKGGTVDIFELTVPDNGFDI